MTASASLCTETSVFMGPKIPPTKRKNIERTLPYHKLCSSSRLKKIPSERFQALTSLNFLKEKYPTEVLIIRGSTKAKQKKFIYPVAMECKLKNIRCTVNQNTKTYMYMITKISTITTYYKK